MIIIIIRMVRASNLRKIDLSTCSILSITYCDHTTLVSKIMIHSPCIENEIVLDYLCIKLIFNKISGQMSLTCGLMVYPEILIVAT